MTSIRFSSKMFFFILTMIMTVSISEGATAKMETCKLNLPKTVGVWTRPDSAQQIDPTNIFKYMNGAGELYLSYRFSHIEVYEYSADNQDKILAELYYMKTPDDAFGLLSLDWSGDPADLNPFSVSRAAPTAPSARAIYGMGLLRICADNIYARVMAYRETPESKDAVFSLGRAIAANQKKHHAEPELLRVLPHTVGSDWKLRNDRIGYFRSHLVLNSLYYISHQNILNLDLSTEAVAVPYENIPDPENHKRVQSLFIKYANSDHARQALEHFHKIYLPEHKQDAVMGLKTERLNFFKVEDGWLGYKQHGKYIALIFECPDRESARMIISHILAKAEGEK